MWIDAWTFVIMALCSVYTALVILATIGRGLIRLSRYLASRWRRWRWRSSYLRADWMPENDGSESKERP